MRVKIMIDEPGNMARQVGAALDMDAGREALRVLGDNWRKTKPGRTFKRDGDMVLLRFSDGKLAAVATLEGSVTMTAEVKALCHIKP
jgi:hypothetical protein